MNTNDLAKLKTFYEESKRDHGLGTPGSLHWQSKESQEIRFKILSQIGDLNNKSIIDLGCGYGDFYKYLIEREIIPANYLGIDIDLDFINVARKNFSGVNNVSFLKSNFMSKDFPNADYVFNCGGLNLKIENYQTEIRRIIKKMYDKANIAVGFNLLRAGAHPEDNIFKPNDPEEIKKYCLKLSSKVEVVLDYVPHDFTVYIYK